MKKALKILSLLLLLIILVLIAIPYFYKDEISAFIKEDINKNFNAKIDYKDISLSLLKDFPNLNVAIDEITIDGIDEFQGTSLAGVKSIDLSLNAKKVFIDKDFEIKRIRIDNLNLNLLVLKNGKANYNILKENPKDSLTTTDKSFVLKLKEYKVTNSNISYNNLANGMKLYLQNIDHYGSGKITDKAYLLKTESEIESLSLEHGIKYINQVKTHLISDIFIEDDYNKYTFNNSDLKVNKLAFDVTKSVIELKDEDIIIDIAFKTKNNELKQLLSLVPKEYLTSVEKITTNGTANLDGFVKGIYNENSYPAYGFDLKVVDGYIKYPDLQETVENINLIAHVGFIGGNNLDNTKINLPKIHFSIADNEVDGSLQIENPINDPLLKTRFKSILDLEKLKNAIKLSGVEQLKGLLDADFSLNGRLSAIEGKLYQKFKASGYFNLKDFSIKTDSIPHTIHISNANMQVTPQALKMENIDATIGENDFKIYGDITNYIAYFLNKDQVLKANFKMYSSHVNLNDFISKSEDKKEETTENGMIKIPKNINLTFIAAVDNLKYLDLDLKDVNGKLTVKDEKANLEAMLMKTLDGQMLLNGVYDSSTETPLSNFDIDMQKMSIVKSANSFSTFKAYAPILQKIQGDFFSDMTLDVNLDNQMSPILHTIKAQGTFNTDNIQLQGINIIKEIGSILNIKELDNPNIDKIKARFSIDKGTMHVKPFTFNLNNIKSGLEGSINLDKEIDFILSLDIPKDMLGSNPILFLEGLVGKLSDLGIKTDLGDIIKMKFSIKGDYKRPKILPAIAGYEGDSTQEIIQEIIEDKVEEVIDETVDKAREEAQKQADKILLQAQQQADSLVSKAQQLALKLNLEAKDQGEKLISKAGNPFEKIAANTAAKELDKQAEKKGNQLVDKAQEKADGLLSKAQDKADKLIQTSIKKN